MAMTEDFSDFLDVDEFAVTAIYTEQDYAHPSVNSVNINGIADFEFDEYGERATKKPTFLCAEDSFSNLQKGDKLTHSDVDYQIVEWEPDGTGLIELKLVRV